MTGTTGGELDAEGQARFARSIGTARRTIQPTVLVAWPSPRRLDAAGAAPALGQNCRGVVATTRSDGRPADIPSSFAVAADGVVWLPP